MLNLFAGNVVDFYTEVSLRVVWVYSVFTIAMNLLKHCQDLFTVILSLLLQTRILLK